jgi:hypothetical protein
MIFYSEKLLFRTVRSPFHKEERFQLSHGLVYGGAGHLNETTPKMACGASFHRDDARRLLSQNLLELRAGDRPIK